MPTGNAEGYEAGMRLLAISDLHLANARNWDALAALPPHPDDWLILGGDIAERLETTRKAFDLLTKRFARVIWVPGNHDLWVMRDEGFLTSDEKYRALVELARRYDIATPEDPYPVWTGPGGPYLIAPLFLLYDYSFRPDHVRPEDVLQWAEEEHSVCADEILLKADPFPDPAAWCHARCRITERRLDDAGTDMPKIIVNHFPLREDLVRIPRIPRFSPWCGTRRTEDWHRRFNAEVVVTGHLHVRRTDWRDGTRFEEVSLGYPRQWDAGPGLAAYLREILPPTAPPEAPET